MKVGVPREIKTPKYRVGLTLDSSAHTWPPATAYWSRAMPVPELARQMTVTSKAGARIPDFAGEAFTSCETSCIVKKPQSSEWTQLRENHILFTYLHVAPDLEQANGLARLVALQLRVKR